MRPWMEAALGRLRLGFRPFPLLRGAMRRGIVALPFFFPAFPVMGRTHWGRRRCRLSPERAARIPDRIGLHKRTYAVLTSFRIAIRGAGGKDTAGPFLYSLFYLLFLVPATKSHIVYKKLTNPPQLFNRLLIFSRFLSIIYRVWKWQEGGT